MTMIPWRRCAGLRTSRGSRSCPNCYAGPSLIARRRRSRAISTNGASTCRPACGRSGARPRRSGGASWARRCPPTAKPSVDGAAPAVREQRSLWWRDRDQRECQRGDDREAHRDRRADEPGLADDGGCWKHTGLWEPLTQDLVWRPRAGHWVHADRHMRPLLSRDRDPTADKGRHHCDKPERRSQRHLHGRIIPNGANGVPRVWTPRTTFLTRRREPSQADRAWPPPNPSVQREIANEFEHCVFHAGWAMTDSGKRTTRASLGGMRRAVSSISSIGTMPAQGRDVTRRNRPRLVQRSQVTPEESCVVTVHLGRA